MKEKVWINLFVVAVLLLPASVIWNIYDLKARGELSWSFWQLAGAFALFPLFLMFFYWGILHVVNMVGHPKYDVEAEVAHSLALSAKARRFSAAVEGLCVAVSIS